MAASIIPSTQARERRGARWAAALPLVCAVHCVAAPVLVLVAPTLALGEPVEAALKIASALLAAVVLFNGLRSHRRAAVLLPVAAGLALWAAPGAWQVGVTGEHLLTALGGALVAAGMLWNGRLRHQASCHACGCIAHAEASVATSTASADHDAGRRFVAESGR